MRLFAQDVKHMLPVECHEVPSAWAVIGWYAVHAAFWFALGHEFEWLKGLI